MQPVESPLKHLLDQNKAWAAKVRKENPSFFDDLASQQTPDYLWIGCSDSRVPANQITGLAPGEVFVHRNVSNLVVHTDFNCLSVIQYAVEVLKVKHVIVCGHYGCGGVLAALRDQKMGLIDNWLRNIRDISDKHESILRNLPDEAAQHAALCELNIIEQAVNLSATTVVQKAWRRSQDLTVHGWVYGLDNGHIHDLNISMNGKTDIKRLYSTVLSKF
jgi:carbonic anhydrase